MFTSFLPSLLHSRRALVYCYITGGIWISFQISRSTGISIATAKVYSVHFGVQAGVGVQNLKVCRGGVRVYLAEAGVESESKIFQTPHTSGRQACFQRTASLHTTVGISAEQVRRYTVLLVQCCQPCGFPANLGLFFFEGAGFFEDLRVAWFNWNLLVFWACFFADFCLFDCFFFKFYVSFGSKRHIGLVFVKIWSFWACFFGFATLLFYLIYLLIFRFVAFSCQNMLGLFFDQITYSWLVFHIFWLVFAK